MIVYLRQDNYGFSGMKYSGVIIYISGGNFSQPMFFKFDLPIQNKEEAYQQAIINFSTNKWIFSDSTLEKLKDKREN